MDYAGLKSSVARWAARDDLTSDIPQFIEFATATFNHGHDGYAPYLRVREMEKTTTLTPVDDGYALPADYLQYITLQEDASIARPLSYVASSYSDYKYADRAGGLSNDFIIDGSTIYSFPVSSNDFTLRYYAKIPELSDIVTSNWLLEKQPQIYLHAALMQLGLFTKDDDLTTRSAAFVKAGIDGLNAEEMMSKYSRSRVRMTQFTP